MSQEINYESILKSLEAVGQEHLLKFYDELSGAEQDELLNDLAQQDWEAIGDLVKLYVLEHAEAVLPKNIEPAPYFERDPQDKKTQQLFAEAKAAGEKLISDGKVANFTVAGGQGTRLGWDGPKGTFPATPLERKPLFQVFAENIRMSELKYDTTIPWYIMTSPLNDQATREFFKANRYFGLKAENVMFFVQGVVPSFSMDGKALLAAKHRLATNPDGHGGSLRALHTSGAIADMTERGIEQISYHQVDNPLLLCVDPLFIGLHALDGAQMSSKMVTKVSAGEKVGVFCKVDNKISVIEYSDMPEELAEQVDENGKLSFNAGSIAIHVIATEFVRDLNAGRFALPWHRAVKKVPYIDIATGEEVNPSEPNAVKLETFVFDALPLCDESVVLETARDEEFGPIKNAVGTDSAESSKRLQIERAGRWLEAAGVRVARKSNGEVDAVIELSLLTANTPEDLEGLKLPSQIKAGQELVL